MTASTGDPVNQGFGAAARMFANAGVPDPELLVQNDAVGQAVSQLLVFLENDQETIYPPVAVELGVQLAVAAAGSRLLAGTEPLDQQFTSSIGDILRKIFDGLIDR